MAKKLKAAELFLSLGLVATLATACGGPAEDAGTTGTDEAVPTETVEPDAVTPDAETPEAPDAEGAEGGEGGEGGEG
jgi:hypothetical protein